MSEQRIPGKVAMETLEVTTEPAATREPGKVEESTVAVQAEESGQSGQSESDQQATSSFWVRTIWLLGLTLAIWLLVDTGLSLWSLWQDFPWLASLLAVLSSALLLVLLRGLHIEYQAGKRLDRMAQRRQAFSQAAATEDTVLFNRNLKPLLNDLQVHYPEQIQSYQQLLEGRETVSARMRLADNTWLGELDRQAQKIIQQESLTVGAGVALLPHPFFDALLVLWRSQRLVRRIGQVYGLSPTGLSSWKLLKMTLLNTLVAGSAETATELAAEQLGYGVIETAVGKGAVQGALMTQRMRRLGRQAQQLCRPWISG